MKHFFLAALTALMALVACQKETPTPEPAPEAPSGKLVPVTFQLTASYSGTKATKRDWEDGDWVYVFFSGLDAPRHLRLEYSEGEFTPCKMNGHYEENWGMVEGETGTMTAIWFAAGHPWIETSSSGGNKEYRFTALHKDSYYLTATIPYKVIDGEIRGGLKMRIPEGYVHFWVEDANAEEKAAAGASRMLYCSAFDAWYPGKITWENDNFSITEYVAGNRTGILYGVPYQGGWMFSGKLNQDYLDEFGGNLLFLYRTGRDWNEQEKDISFASFYAKNVTVQSHSAFKLPAEGSDRWIPMGEKEYVYFDGDNSTSYYFATLNDGAYLPPRSDSYGDIYGTRYTFGQAPIYVDGFRCGNMYVPRKEYYEFLLSDKMQWTPVKHLYAYGFLVTDGTASHLFLPFYNANMSTFYWTSTEHTPGASAYHLSLQPPSSNWLALSDPSYKGFIRRASSWTIVIH